MKSSRFRRMMQIALASSLASTHPGPSGHPSEEGNRPHPLPLTTRQFAFLR